MAPLQLLRFCFAIRAIMARYSGSPEISSSLKPPSIPFGDTEEGMLARYPVIRTAPFVFATMSWTAGRSHGHERPYHQSSEMGSR